MAHEVQDPEKAIGSEAETEAEASSPAQEQPRVDKEKTAETSVEAESVPPSENDEQKYLVRRLGKTNKALVSVS
jgi:hypothetical protein